MARKQRGHEGPSQWLVERFRRRAAANPELMSAREELKAEFLASQPEFASLSPEEQGRLMMEHAEQEGAVRRRKLRAHLEVFSDAVVAIIVTVMLLEIPLPVGGESDYATFLGNIGIFFVSFIIIANFWYENHKLFQITDEISEVVVVLHLLFLAFLGLIPLLTRWIMIESTSFAMLNYGIALLLVNVLANALTYVVTRDRFAHMPQTFRFWRRFWASRFAGALASTIVMTVVAYLFPRVGHWVFVVGPVLSFLGIAGNQEARFVVGESEVTTTMRHNFLADGTAEPGQ